VNWRLIDTGPLNGPTNMAVDEALLTCFDPEKSTPVLRLYGWNPPALSVGRFQNVSEILDLERCRSDNVPVVRRITGGGVIYHADELTYSIVCAPHHLPHAATVKDSFRVLTAFLLRFYRSLGLPAEYATDVATNGATLGERTPFCFAGRESFDILVNSKKIGGNAQRRLQNAIFQHGSIPLYNRVDKGISYLLEKPANLTDTVSALADFGVEIIVEQLKETLIKEFSDGGKTDVTSSSLNDKENEYSGILANSKFCCNSWNFRGEMQSRS
jgi:lipoate-protein ligase A